MIRSLVVVAAAAVVAAGCAKAPDGPRPNERGNMVKSAGEAAVFTNRVTGLDELTLTLHAMAMTDRCERKFGTFTEVTMAVRGHFLVLDVSVTTSPGLTPLVGNVALNPNAFSTIGPDGATETDLASVESYACFPGERMPSGGFQPAQTYRGKIVLDTANTSGVLIYTSANAKSGWEWAFTV